MDQPVHARDQSSVDDEENPRIAIPTEIQNEPVHEETDVRGILRCERGDLSPCSFPGTGGGCRILYEGELEYFIRYFDKNTPATKETRIRIFTTC